MHNSREGSGMRLRPLLSPAVLDFLFSDLLSLTGLLRSRCSESLEPFCKTFLYDRGRYVFSVVEIMACNGDGFRWFAGRLDRWKSVCNLHFPWICRIVVPYQSD